MTVEPRPQPGRTETCPPWCVMDHEKPFYRDGSGVRSHLGPATNVHVGGGYLSAYPVQLGPEDKSEVAVREACYGAPPDKPWPFLPLPAEDARTLARIIGRLADAAPEQHRDLAAGIERAAAEIEPEAGQ